MRRAPNFHRANRTGVGSFASRQKSINFSSLRACKRAAGGQCLYIRTDRRLNNLAAPDAQRTLRFPQCKGEQLARALDLPLGKPTAYALFAHCFTCGKDNLAAKRIAERLTLLGIAVLRFDFTGLGGSEGEFANTHFSSNVDDLVAAADHLRKTHGAPAILIGHSLGGAAVLAAAHRIAEARAVVDHRRARRSRRMSPACSRIRSTTSASKGEVEVQLAGRPFRIRREFLDDVAEQRLTNCSRICARRCWFSIRRPTTLVGIDNASQIFATAKHPKSFVSLAGADHLLSKKSDAVYVANVIAAWAERYLDQPRTSTEAESRGRPRAGARDARRQIPAGDH